MVIGPIFTGREEEGLDITQKDRLTYQSGYTKLRSHWLGRKEEKAVFNPPSFHSKLTFAYTMQEPNIP